ncbi:MAG: hypothetical protein ACLRVU_06820 [Beduini sp.]|uniref:hypothetical protein n=1 Tax=Beduini sp. TaxID=1922300 RepID=UPI0039A043F6
MLNWFFTDLFSSYDQDQIAEMVRILNDYGIKTKVGIESGQMGMPNTFSSYSNPSPLDYDDGQFSKMYTLYVKKKDIVKAKELLSIK